LLPGHVALALYWRWSTVYVAVAAGRTGPERFSDFRPKPNGQEPLNTRPPGTGGSLMIAATIEEINEAGDS
jgi:hypothetical protein